MIRMILRLGLELNEEFVKGEIVLLEFFLNDKKLNKNKLCYFQSELKRLKDLI